MSGAVAQSGQALHADAPQAVFFALAAVVSLCLVYMWVSLKLLYRQRDEVREALVTRIRASMARRLRLRRPGSWPSCSATALRQRARSHR
jgi:hypothetical protein